MSVIEMDSFIDNTSISSGSSSIFSMEKETEDSRTSKSAVSPTKKQKNGHTDRYDEYHSCEPYCDQAQDLNKRFVVCKHKKFDKEKFIDYYSSCILEGR